MPEHRVQIDRSIALKAAVKDRLESRNSGSQLCVQLLCLSLARNSFLKFALPLVRPLCGGTLPLKTQRLLPIPHIVAVSALLASQVAPLWAGPEQGGYRSFSYIRSDSCPKGLCVAAKDSTVEMNQRTLCLTSWTAHELPSGSLRKM